MAFGSIPQGYFKFLTAALLTMAAGAQVVHLYYRPLQDMDKWIEQEKSLISTKETKTEKT